MRSRRASAPRASARSGWRGAATRRSSYPRHDTRHPSSYPSSSASSTTRRSSRAPHTASPVRCLRGKRTCWSRWRGAKRCARRWRGLATRSASISSPSRSAPSSLPTSHAHQSSRDSGAPPPSPIHPHPTAAPLARPSQADPRGSRLGARAPPLQHLAQHLRRVPTPRQPLGRGGARRR